MDAPEPELGPAELEVRIELLESRLRARTLEAETELKAKERLRRLAGELNERVERMMTFTDGLQREAAASSAAVRRRDAELSTAQRNLSQFRQKNAGHEAHIESLRADLEQAEAARVALGEMTGRLAAAEESVRLLNAEIEEARAMRAKYEALTARAEKAETDLLATRSRFEALNRSLAAAQTALDHANLSTHRSQDEVRRLQSVIDNLEKNFEARVAEEVAKRLKG